MITFETFKYNVQQWAIERKIPSEGTINGQIEKLKEEALEVDEAFKAVDTQNMLMEIGDVYVTLNNLCACIGVEPEKCMEMAWLKIKDRKGEMRQGTFVKEADL